MPPLNKKQQGLSVPRMEPSRNAPARNERRRLYYVIILLVLLNIGVLSAYVFLFGFILQKKDSIIRAVSALDIEQLREQQLKILKDGFRATEPKRKALDEYFVDSQKVVSFIENIESMGRRANVALEFNFVNIRDTAEDGVLAIAFETFGSFQEIFHFLQLVENLPAQLSLTKFLFDKDVPRGIEVRKASDTWHAVFTVTVLSFEHK